MTVKLYDRAGMNATGIGTGTTVALGSALGAVAPNVCSFIDFGTAGVANGDSLRILLLDTGGAWEISTFTYNSSGPTLTGRTVEASSNGGSAINLSGSEQAFIMAGAADIITNFNGRSPTAGAITPASGDYSISGNTVALPQSYLAGLQLSNDGTTPNSVLDISAGQARDSTNATNIVLAAFTKSTAGTWVAGSGSNGMGNGLTIAASTWYHVFAIINAGAADVYFDTSVTGANQPASTTAIRRIGSFKTDGSSHIIAFTQFGDHFQWTALINDVAANNPGTAAVTRTLTVPIGVQVVARISVIGYDNGTGSSPGAIYVSDLAANDETISVAKAGAFAFTASAISAGSGGYAEVLTNTSAQVRSKIQNSNANTTLYIHTHGWIDARGKLT